MPEDKEYLTKEKFDELEKELNNLRSVERKKILEELDYAKQLGDLTENAEYHEARKKQGDLEDRVATLEALLKRASIVAHKKSDKVTVGSTVIIKKIKGGDERTFHVVGTEEADMSKGNISNRSPLGSALIGRMKGDEVSVETPAGTTSYLIQDIQ